MYEWHIGDPVDWGDGFMDVQNWGHGNDGDKDSQDHETSRELKREQYSRKHGIFAMNINMSLHFNILIWHLIWIH